MAKHMDAQARKKALQNLPLWTYDARFKALVREFVFADFGAA